MDVDSSSAFSVQLRQVLLLLLVLRPLVQVMKLLLLPYVQSFNILLQLFVLDIGMAFSPLCFYILGGLSAEQHFDALVIFGGLFHFVFYLIL